MTIFTNGILAIILTISAFIIAYLVIPRFMNFKRVLEISKDSIYIEKDRIKIEKNNIRNINLKGDNSIEIIYLIDNELNTVCINDQVHIDIKKLYKILKLN